MKTTYSVFNNTKGTLICQDLKIAKTISDQILGLLKKSNPRSLMFKTSFGIHTFFLKGPIDVIVLNNQNTVVKLATVKPNRLFFWNPKYFMVMELPIGTIKKSRTTPKDQIKFLNGDKI